MVACGHAGPPLLAMSAPDKAGCGRRRHSGSTRPSNSFLDKGQSMQTKTLGALPESVQKKLEAFTRSLESILQKNLVALLVFGSAIRGGYDENRSDVDVLVVLQDDSRQVLQSISEPLRQAR